MRENAGDIRFMPRSSNFDCRKFFFMQLGHRHCLETAAFILDIYL